jgi:glycosyltransferase involved in cell wall biosynthesis
VSVVIPCHNYAQFLEEAIRSALDQQHVDVDVTIVDDASTDSSLEIAHRWEREDTRVSVVAHGTNQGHIRTFNDALDSATAPYVVKLDPDDLLPPGSLRRSVDVLEAHRDVVFVYGPVQPFTGPAPTESHAVGRRRLKVWRGSRWIAIRVRRLRNVIYQPEVMIRVAALKVVGGHRPEVPAASDLNLWLRLASVGSVARIGGIVQGFYRNHAQSMQHTVHAGKLVDFRARRDAFDVFFKEAGSRLPGARQLKQENQRALARDAVRLAFEEIEDGAPAREYLDEARALDPTVTRTILWRNNERRLSDPAHSGPLVRVERLKRSLDGKITFRVWRRFGL